MNKIETRLAGHMRRICCEIGERHLGSEGEKLAAQYIEHCLKEYGYRVHKENFAAPGWSYGRYRLLISDSGEELPCFPCFYSNSCSISGKMVKLDMDEPCRVNASGVKGKICFYCGDIDGVGKTNELAEKLDALGAAALVIMSPYQETYSTKIVRSPFLNFLAVVSVSKTAALKIARNLNSEFVLEVEAKKKPVNSCNVTGRMKETKKSKILVGAHYDSAPGIQGAADNASGVALMLELAKSFSGSVCANELEFAAFGAEEFGGPGYGTGGFEYVKKHLPHLKNIACMLCLDNVGTFLGKPSAYIGRSSMLKKIVQRRSETIKALDFRAGSDNGIFHDNGIPTVWFSDGMPSSGAGHFPLHSPLDTLEVVDISLLARMHKEISKILRELINIRDLSGLKDL